VERDVVRGRVKQMWVVSKEAQTLVALLAEQCADRAGSMIVV
jgi:hypothetical protein